MLGGAVDLSEEKLDEPLPSWAVARDTGRWSVAGTPEQLAAAVPERFEAGVRDVLSINGIAGDRTHDFVVGGPPTEPRRRGIVKEDYRGSTLRDNLGLTL
ncbi:hypothetical protein ACGFJ7_16910 [Actinoplanes sp. NPDC048988]|uniref:hypothetical protein n=1 Tax=Actinoplanes sp. NPDC048988 TaxID=3363901 RepID=UPI0037229E63